VKSIFVLPLFFLGLAGHDAIALAQSAGTFTTTGSMTTPRMGHTATLLNNGRVLIAGGYQNVPGGQHCEGSLHVFFGFLDCVTALNSAELYDPTTGTFSPTGNMSGSGLGHTATLLPSGKVLIHWGTSAELYDPSNGLFTVIQGVFPGGALATLLNNGKVLINGPWPAALTGFPALLYDPANGTFLPTGDYAGTPGSPGAAALLPDGRVLVAGSLGCCYDVAQTEIYDPSSDSFSLTAPIFTQSNGTPVMLLNNGKVLAFAGWDVNDDNATPIDAGLYDPTAGTFRTIGNMTMARSEFTATLLPDGTMFITGGDYAPSSTEVYDAAAERFSASANMLIPRTEHTATLLPDGRVLIAGGLPDSLATTSTAELYTPLSLTPSPALFSLSGDGTGQGAIWHADTGKIASSANPATTGDVLSMYTTSLFEGGVIPPQVAIGGQLAEIPFFGDAPGYPGYYQVNFRMPSGVAPGSAVSVRLNYLGRPSNEVNIGVQ
jgi:hypothetical protein